MEKDLVRRRLRDARIGRLGTVGAEGRPHVVPCCFVLLGETIYSAVDAKPKSTLALRRLDNIRHRGLASLLVDHYSEDWSALWWVRADGPARVIEVTDDARVGLTAKYTQYGSVAIPGPLIAIDVDTWAAWP